LTGFEFLSARGAPGRAQQGQYGDHDDGDPAHCGEGLSQEPVDGRAEDVVGDGAHVLDADPALAIEKERLGDPVDAVVLPTPVPFRILGDREGENRSRRRNFWAASRLVLDVDTQHDHARALTIAAPVPLEHRRPPRSTRG